MGLRTYTAFGELAEQRLVRDAGPGRMGLAEVFKRTYAHDENGQITSIEDSRWAQGPAGPEPAVLAFRHDADGNLLTKSDASGRHGGVSWRYIYNAAGRLAEVWRDDGTGEVRVGAYGYDVLGRRVARETWELDGSGLNERMVWDGDVPAERQRSTCQPLVTTTASGASASDVAVRTYSFQIFEPVALLS